LGEYYVSVYNKCGEQTIPIVVAHLDCELGVFIPTAFSPNGDGVNEYFAPVFSHLVSDYHLEIYDRWGKRCYISENASARWDGKYLSQDVPEGVFTYHLRYRFNQKQNERTGTITVVR
jgi:gliding motility-associated-like protein